MNGTKEFVPVWAAGRTVPAAMLDFEEKYNSFFEPNGRLMSVAHRGDWRNYPENSVEGYLSAILAGADIVEVDVAKTKDDQLVVMHDVTLNRTTDVDAKQANTTLGLPESDNVADWTLAQLRELRLKNNYSLTSSSGAVTNYLIPTLEDVIKICKGRCLITLDKVGNFEWEDVEVLLKRNDAYLTVMLPYNYSRNRYADQLGNIITEMKKCTNNLSPAMMSRVLTSDDSDNTNYKGNLAKELSYMRDWVTKNNFPKALRYGGYNADDTATFSSYLNSYRVYVETISGTSANYDNLAGWTQIDTEGYGMIMTNNIHRLTEYIQDTYFSNTEESN